MIWAGTLSDHIQNPWLMMLAGAGLIMGALTLNAFFLVWAERKVSARIQRRLGPMEYGWQGMHQTFWDMLKLISKQLITPRDVDKPLYHLAPVVVFAPVVATCAMFPFIGGFTMVDVDLGLILVFAFAGIGIIGIFMAGWGSNNKYALLGAMRSVAQNISYEIPLILSSLCVVLVTRSTSLTGIVEADRPWWFWIIQWAPALIYIIAATAETNRAPFDIPEAESELIAGFHTEYSGMRFAIFFFAEYTNMLIVSMVATILFLGGWLGPFSDTLGPLWFTLKVYFCIFLMMWFRWTYPRLRFDQLMSFCWGVLVPASIACLLLTAILAKVF